MPQKFLSVRQSDFERCRTRSPNAPWIRLHRSLFREREFMNLPTAAKFLYVGLLILSTEHENRIYNDPTWIGQLLDIPPTEIDLKPLYRCGLLQATNVHRVLREREGERDREGDGVAAQAPTPSHKVIPLRGSIFPDGFTFDARAEALAKSWGLNPHKELAAFRDHHTAKGSIFKDWQAAYRNWLRNSVKFSQRGAS